MNTKQNLNLNTRLNFITVCHYVTGAEGREEQRVRTPPPLPPILRDDQ